ncbi:hypothetical protein BEWA_019360 [Theileria equi strain WA]|uniref:t-SNARE coiled-coil homology domain-containing protein n=1 Tax=Theileria equi strain WA TaxID=1537102 RepID=L0AVN8_THEEQ|nr:hypothetical protein BEWA_019360 [Theileria equi strain WA]AFZ79091.1 hypothetical protein BEWA_019360 [Theileria equi strain WA]|eukprot:XP_004828757.1 hypothetical protein BEWA_019360 [Theileria equi strain WA]
MYNRTHQLQALAAGQAISNAYHPDCIITVSDELSLQNGPKDDEGEASFGQDFVQFMAEVDATRKCIKFIDDGTESIKKLLNLSLDVVTSAQNDEISTNLNKLIEQTNIICTQCKSNITKLEPKKSHGTPTETRIRTNAYNVCVKHFQNAMKRYQDAQVNFKKSIKDRATRQIQLIYPEMNEYELEQILVQSNTHSAVEYVAKSNILGGINLRDAVTNIQGKYNDILALEQSMEGLKQMMVDLAGVVSYQGDLIEQIERNALEAVDYTDRANAQLIKAQHNKKRGGRLLMWLTCSVICGGIIVIIPVIIRLA